MFFHIFNKFYSEINQILIQSAPTILNFTEFLSQYKSWSNRQPFLCLHSNGQNLNIHGISKSCCTSVLPSTQHSLSYLVTKWTFTTSDEMPVFIWHAVKTSDISGGIFLPCRVNSNSDWLPRNKHHVQAPVL